MQYGQSGYLRGGIKTPNYSGLYEKDVEILGRPIRLADVLLADMKRVDDKCAEKDCRKKEYPIGALKILSKWDLKDDNLDHQSEECKQFLINLLV